MTVGAVWVYLLAEAFPAGIAGCHSVQFRTRNGACHAGVGCGAVLPHHYAFGFAHHRRFVEPAVAYDGGTICIFRHRSRSRR